MQLLIRPDLGRKAYRLRCRVRVPAGWGIDLKSDAALGQVETWISDMEKQGWDYRDEHGLKLTGGPFAVTRPTSLIRPPSRLTNRDMLPRLLAGDPCRDNSPIQIQTVPSLDQVEEWEYEVAAVFVHKTILVEQPDKREEIYR